MVWYGNLFEEMAAEADGRRAAEKSAYMRNQFPFLGLTAPVIQKICAPYFKKARKERIVDFDFTDLCWRREHREYQYAAKDYLISVADFLDAGHVEKIRLYIVTKSWWDTVDGLDRVVGNIALRHPGVNGTLLRWSADGNFWLRRAAIDHQLLRKEKTDRKLLEAILKNNLNQKEFFINKAIGWSLRDFSKTDAAWVASFIEKYREGLSPLSIREGSKYLPAK